MVVVVLQLARKDCGTFLQNIIQVRHLKSTAKGPFVPGGVGQISISILIFLNMASLQGSQVAVSLLHSITPDTKSCFLIFFSFFLSWWPRLLRQWQTNQRFFSSIHRHFVFLIHSRVLNEKVAENTTVDKAPPSSGLHSDLRGTLPDLKVKKSKASGMGNLTNQVMINILQILHCSQMGFFANRVVLLGIA